jgi:hypothetical protein
MTGWLGQKRSIVWFVSGLLVGLLLVSPASAHVGTSITHLWNLHLRPLADARYVNLGEKATNADKLDGKDSTAFQDRLLRAHVRTEPLPELHADVVEVSSYGITDDMVSTVLGPGDQLYYCFDLPTDAQNALVTPIVPSNQIGSAIAGGSVCGSDEPDFAVCLFNTITEKCSQGEFAIVVF